MGHGSVRGPITVKTGIGYERVVGKRKEGIRICLSSH